MQSKLVGRYWCLKFVVTLCGLTLFEEGSLGCWVSRPGWQAVCLFVSYADRCLDVPHGVHWGIIFVMPCSWVQAGHREEFSNTW